MGNLKQITIRNNETVKFFANIKCIIFTAGDQRSNKRAYLILINLNFTQS